MPFKLMIEADNLGIAQAALAGVARALAEETGPAVTSDQAPSDIVQNEDQAELDLTDGALANLITEVHAAVVEPVPEAVPEPKKRGRKPKLVAVPDVEDVEPPPEVITEEDEAEAEGAVDAPESTPSPSNMSMAELREAVREIMDAEGIPEAIARLAKAGYKQVKDVPPADFARVHAILQVKA